MPYRILSISYDSVLLETRHMMLEQAGYEVVSAVGFAEAIEHCARDFDLIIMGHSIPQQEKRAMLEEIHRHGCNAPLLSLLRIGEAPIPEAIRGIDPSPQQLMKAVTEILSESAQISN
jgi:CheY-like chemotaxis protein